ncbi:hypothetical protein [Salsuginibacillus kocurii]|nr:hypothetical protein [Salsuginibacillus kocurii]
MSKKVLYSLLTGVLTIGVLAACGDAEDMDDPGMEEDPGMEDDGGDMEG